MTEIRAAIFDIGGVLTHSPVTAIVTFTRDHGIADASRTRIFAGNDSAWSRFERSELSPAGFAKEFDVILSEEGGNATGEQFLAWFGKGFGQRPEMFAVVRALQGKVRLGAITNNVANENPDPTRVSGANVHGLFEVVIESAKVGLRKPEPAIYQMACDALSVPPHQAVFLDDMGVNLKGAQALGMATIKVDHTLSAIDELEALVGFPLPRP